jgi:hypothetical protein
MPYEWKEPDLFLEHNGVAVYHCYDDDSIVSEYWYTTDITDSDTEYPNPETAQFDVRELPNQGLDANDWRNHKAIVHHAIAEGLVTGEPAITEPSLTVKVEVIGGMAHVVEQPPGVEVEIIDRDQR